LELAVQELQALVVVMEVSKLLQLLQMELIILAEVEVDKASLLQVEMVVKAL
jgi:hypothetical protein